MSLQVFAWGDNDHGQQGNGTTTVNRKPTLVQGLEGQKITRVACGSSHSVAWTTVDVTTPSVHEPVLFQTARDSLGASYLGLFTQPERNSERRNIEKIILTFAEKKMTVKMSTLSTRWCCLSFKTDATNVVVNKFCLA